MSPTGRACSETIRRCGSAGAAFYLSHFHIINVIPQSGILPAVYCLWVTCGDRCLLAAEVALLETASFIIADFVLLCNLSSFVALPWSCAWRRMWLREMNIINIGGWNRVFWCVTSGLVPVLQSSWGLSYCWSRCLRWQLSRWRCCDWGRWCHDALPAKVRNSSAVF